jgi:raffinose/stachyose/melibiose transport system permease protein
MGEPPGTASGWNGYGAGRVASKTTSRVQERAFRTALVNNLLIIVVSLAVQLPLALFAAVLLADRIRGAVTLRMIFFLPYILAEVAAGLIWRFVYDGDYGLLAKLVTTLGFAAPHVLADRDLAMYAILAVIVWKYFGFHMMLYIAGLQQIDPNLYEAAHIDGATSRQMLWRVTFPLLGPTIRLSVFFAVLGSLQLFDLIMPLTKGGPADSTQTMVTYLYSFGVTRMRIGSAARSGWSVVICVSPLATPHQDAP